MAEIDHYSAAPVHLRMFFGDTNLSSATGFIWEVESAYYLITNWHNLSGRHPLTGRHLSNTAAEPDRVSILWNRRDFLGQKTAALHRCRSTECEPLWLIHPTLREKADVAALPVKPPGDAVPYPINRMPSEAIRLEVGHDVYVVGYPYGISHSELPIWKRASIASEPEVIDPTNPCILVDTATRPGMSGSPVIRRTWAMTPLEGGEISIGRTSSRLVGIYSGRLYSRDDLDAQLGLVWPKGVIEEVVNGGVIDR